MPMLSHLCLPSPVLTPVLTKEGQTPTVSDYFALPLQLSRRINPRLKHIPIAKMLSQKPKHMPENKARDQGYPNNETTIAIC